jgi:AcrR family transcriptional regulator
MERQQTSSAPPRKRRGRPPAATRDKTRRALVDAAAQQMATVGFEAMTLESVAVQIGLTRSAVYRYFDSKRDLARVVLREAVPQVEEYFAQESVGAATVDEQLRALVRACVRVASESPESILSYFHLGKVVADDPELGELFEARSIQVRRIIRDLVRAGVARGEVAPGAERAAIDGLSGMVLALAAGVAEAGGNERVRGQVLLATDLILQRPDWLLAAPPDPTRGDASG